MIRFACPGCNATYTVDDAKGGKAGKCPKCAAQFVIPAAGEGGPPPAPEPRRTPAPPPPPPPPAADPGAVEIKPCPKCAARLTVAASDLGVDVECPYCKAVYTAKKAGGPAADRPSRREALPSEEARERPSRRPREDDDEDDDRPSRRKRAAADADDEDDRPSRRSRRDEDDEEDDRPRKKKRRRRSYEDHRGTTVLLLGIFGCLCCGFLALAAVIMGFQDLGKMNREEMDPDGKTSTTIGIVFGFLGVLIWIATVVINVAMAGK